MPKLREVYNQDGVLYGYRFYCPGCKDYDVVRTGPAGSGPVWSFTGTVNNPTIRPSLLKRWGRGGGDTQLRLMCCHAFITDGKIEFLGDCSHSLAGVTVELTDVEEGVQ